MTQDQTATWFDVVEAAYPQSAVGRHMTVMENTYLSVVELGMAMMVLGFLGAMMRNAMVVETTEKEIEHMKEHMKQLVELRL